MTGRIAVYAKATKDRDTSCDLHKYVLVPLIEASAQLRGKAPRVIVECAFNNGVLGETQPPGSVNWIYRSFPNHPFRAEITPSSVPDDFFDRGKTVKVNFDELGTENALADFLTQVAQGGEFDRHDLLVLWGHGSGSRILESPLSTIAGLRGRGTLGIRADNLLSTKTIFGDDGCLQPGEIENALRHGNHRPGLVALNTCQGGTIEFAHALSGSASYLLASPKTVFSNEWPYQAWMQSVYSRDQEIDPVSGGKAFIDAVGALELRDTFLALFDLAKIGAIKSAVKKFVNAAATLSASDRAAVFDARTECENFQSPNGGTVAVDIHQFATSVKKRSVLVMESQEIVEAIRSAVLHRYDKRKIDDIYGLSIIFPVKSLEPDKLVEYWQYLPTIEDHVLSTFVHETGWREFLRNLDGM